MVLTEQQHTALSADLNRGVSGMGGKRNEAVAGEAAWDGR